MFKKALPVWAKEQENEFAVTLGFYCKVPQAQESAVLRVATSGFYRVFINGEFVYYGPIRCAHGHYRVDEVPLFDRLTRSENHIAVEVVNYAVDSFASLQQPGFIQMEWEQDGAVLAVTDVKATSFTYYQLMQRERKIQRYSVQRTFAEAYHLSPDTDAWRMGGISPDAQPCELAQQEDKTLLPRELPYHTFPSVSPVTVCSCGTVTVGQPPEKLYRNRSLDTTAYTGVPIEEQPFVLTDDIQCLTTTPVDVVAREYTGTTFLKANGYEILSLARECTGFIRLTVHCDAPATLLVTFDEILTSEGDVSALRMQCVNILRLDLQPGTHTFMTMEPYGFKYVKVMAFTGDVTVTDLQLVEYVHPYPCKTSLPGGDEQEKAIYEAAWHTLRQNAADLFTDCPTRERAGWLCDSFFIGRVAQFFTGETLMEKQFLENFILPDRLPDVPDGMVPMCYPSDHRNGEFILNWGLWYVAELDDYTRRTGDTTLAERSRDLVYRMVRYLQTIENKDGLLDRLPSWAFVEWSKANDLVMDINFPNNMIYQYMLRAAGHLYGDTLLLDKADALKQTILVRSFNGEFFVDNEVYRDGVPVSTGETSETCQYHAFFFGVATPESHPQLWKTLTTEFGPQRAITGAYPKVYPSNAFTGNVLRLDVLLRYGLYEQCRREVVGYYADMARITGTLWENMTSTASCNHGFAAYPAYLLYYAMQQKEPPFTLR